MFLTNISQFEYIDKLRVAHSLPVGVSAGNRKKAIRNVIYYNDRVNLGLATRHEYGRKGRICNPALQGK